MNTRRVDPLSLPRRWRYFRRSTTHRGEPESSKARPRANHHLRDPPPRQGNDGGTGTQVLNLLLSIHPEELVAKHNWREVKRMPRADQQKWGPFIEYLPYPLYMGDELQDINEQVLDALKMWHANRLYHGGGEPDNTPFERLYATDEDDRMARGRMLVHKLPYAPLGPHQPTFAGGEAEGTFPPTEKHRQQQAGPRAEQPPRAILPPQAKNPNAPNKPQL